MPPDYPSRTGWESGRLCESPGHRRSLTASNYVVILSQNQKPTSPFAKTPVCSPLLQTKNTPTELRKGQKYKPPCTPANHRRVAWDAREAQDLRGQLLRSDLSGDMSVQSGQIFQSKGLVSIDRSEAAALLSTTPRLRTRSSTNDFAPLRCMGWVYLRPDRPADPSRLTAVSLWLCHRGRRNTVDPRISLPPDAEALTVSSHVWAGF